MAIAGVNPITESGWNGYLGPNAAAIIASNPALKAQFGAFQTAQSAIPGAENAAVGQYNTQTGNVQQSALGALNSRGLGRSLAGNSMPGQSTPVSGYGSGALANLAASRQTGLAGLKAGYTAEANNLNNNLIDTAYNANNTYNTQELQRQALLRAQNASDPLNPGNIFANLAKGAASAIPLL